jgi:hypothetical protein
LKPLSLRRDGKILDTTDPQPAALVNPRQA